MIWTEEQKTEMQRLRDAGFSNATIGAEFNTSADNIRKVLARRLDKVKQPTTEPAEPATATGKQLLREAFEAAPDARPPEFRAALDRRAVRPPMIMPKDFQKERFNPEE